MVGKALLLSQNVIIARTISVNDFGTYSYLLAIVNVISIPLMAGLTPYILRALSKRNLMENVDVNSVLNTTVIYILSMFFLVSSIIYIFNYFLHLNIKHLNYLPYMLIVAIFKALQNRISAVLYACGKPLPSIISQNIILTTVTIIGVMFVKTSDPIINVLLSIILGQVVALIYSRYYSLVSYLDCKIKRKYKLEFIKYKKILPYIIFFSVTTLNNEVMVLIIERFFTKEQVAFYKLAFSLSILLTIGVQIINSFIANDISSINERGELQKKIKSLSRVNFILSTFILVCSISYIEEIVSLVYGDRYLGVKWVYIILATGFWSSSLFCSVSLVMNMKGLVDKATRSFILSLLTLLIMASILIPTLGFLGAVIAQSLSLIVSSIMMNIYLKRNNEITTFPF